MSPQVVTRQYNCPSWGKNSPKRSGWSRPARISRLSTIRGPGRCEIRLSVHRIDVTLAYGWEVIPTWQSLHTEVVQRGSGQEEEPQGLSSSTSGAYSCNLPHSTTGAGAPGLHKPSSAPGELNQLRAANTRQA